MKGMNDHVEDHGKIKGELEIFYYSQSVDQIELRCKRAICGKFCGKT